MNYEFQNNNYIVNIDYGVEKNLKKFKEEVLNSLYTIYKNNVNNLMFSGGMDGSFILRSLIELGIKPNLYTMCHCQNNTDYDSLASLWRCQQFNYNKPYFFYMDPEKLFNHMKFCLFEKKIVYATPHSYFVDYFLTKNKEINFFCGMSCEFKISPYNHLNIIFPPHPRRIKINNPGRLFGFDNSKTFLSYVNHPIFKNNYLKKPPDYPSIQSLVYIRDLIYNDCYEDVEILIKRPPTKARKVQKLYFHFISSINREYHEYSTIFKTKPFIFDVDSYLKNKNH